MIEAGAAWWSSCAADADLEQELDELIATTENCRKKMLAHST
ncbi:hypothetical protein OKW34_002826 [Paraburkholderia youngii]